MTDTNPTADNVRAAAERLHQAATEATLCAPTGHRYVRLTPEQAHAIATAWEHQADDMHDYEAYEEPLERVDGTYTTVVKNEHGSLRFDWGTTLDAARIYLGEAAK